MANTGKIAGQQPEALAALSAAAKAGGQKPRQDGLTATPQTSPQKADVAQEVDAATKVLREGATHKNQGAAAAVRKLPDRVSKGGK